MPVVENVMAGKSLYALCRTLVQGSLARDLCRGVGGFGIRFPFEGLLTFRICLWVTDGHGIY